MLFFPQQDLLLMPQERTAAPAATAAPKPRHTLMLQHKQPPQQRRQQQLLQPAVRSHPWHWLWQLQLQSITKSSPVAGRPLPCACISSGWLRCCWQSGRSRWLLRHSSNKWAISCKQQLSTCHSSSPIANSSRWQHSRWMLPSLVGSQHRPQLHQQDKHIPLSSRQQQLLPRHNKDQQQLLLLRHRTVNQRHQQLPGSSRTWTLPEQLLLLLLPVRMLVRETGLRRKSGSPALCLVHSAE